MATNNSINLPKNGFYANLNAASIDNVTGNGTQYTILYDTLVSGANYNTGTGIWTVPATGKYLVGYSVHIGGVGLLSGYTIYQTSLFVNANQYQSTDVNPVAVFDSVTTQVLLPPSIFCLDLTATDQLHVMVYVWNGLKAIDIIGNDNTSYFWAREIL